MEKDSLELGLNMLEKSVAMYRELKDDYNLVMVLSQLAFAELQLNKIGNAERHADEAFRQSESLKLPEGMGF